MSGLLCVWRSYCPPSLSSRFSSSPAVFSGLSEAGDASVGAGVFSPFCGGVFVFFSAFFLLLKHMNAAAAAPIAAAASTENTIIQTRFTLCVLSL